MKKVLIILLIVATLLIASLDKIIEAVVEFGATSYSKSELEDGIKPFEKYDFKSGGYVVIGVSMWSSNTPNVLIDDITTLEQLKTKWVFHKPAMVTKRMYTYFITLLKDGKVVNEFAIDLSRNTNVDAIRTSGGALWFDRDLLKGYAPLFENNQTFSTIEEGRKYIDQLLDDDNFVYGPLPRWYLFDGRLGFENSVPCDIEDEFTDKEDEVEKKISRHYEKNSYQLKWKEGTYNRDNPQTLCISSYELACNESVAKKFDDFVITQPWQEFDELTWTYWSSY